MGCVGIMGLLLLAGLLEEGLGINPGISLVVMFGAVWVMAINKYLKDKK